MRQFTTFEVALNELKRELAEMGIRLRTKSVQNLDISDNPDYDMLEITNYTYVVTDPKWEDIPLDNKPYFDAEFKERIGDSPVNPGQAWNLDREYWQQFLTTFGKFDYTYEQTMAVHLPLVILALQKDPNTRRAFLPIFDAGRDCASAFDRRIPCSLGYQFQYRQGQLNVTYLQRSADFSKHFNKDIALADRLKCYVAEQCDMKPGYFCHWLGSLHIFAKDVKGVF